MFMKSVCFPTEWQTYNCMLQPEQSGEFYQSSPDNVSVFWSFLLLSCHFNKPYWKIGRTFQCTLGSMKIQMIPRGQYLTASVMYTPFISLFRDWIFSFVRPGIQGAFSKIQKCLFFRVTPHRLFLNPAGQFCLYFKGTLGLFQGGLNSYFCKRAAFPW